MMILFGEDGREKWQIHHEIVDIISKDPVFDKLKRYII
jgi:hypothetical protein